MTNPSPKVSSDGAADAKRQGPGPDFEVEIYVGNRAVDVNRDVSTAPTSTSTPSPLALQRRQRARQRRKLMTLSLLSLGLGVLLSGTAVLWQPLLQGDLVARVNGQPLTM